MLLKIDHANYNRFTIPTNYCNHEKKTPNTTTNIKKVKEQIIPYIPPEIIREILHVYRPCEFWFGAALINKEWRDAFLECVDEEVSFFEYEFGKNWKMKEQVEKRSFIPLDEKRLLKNPRLYVCFIPEYTMIKLALI